DGSVRLHPLAPSNRTIRVLRSRWDMRQSVCSTEYFPLTLALSLRELREREQEASDSCLADGCWAHSGTSVIERRWTVLPLPRLPRGEGWGEGEPSVAHPAVQSVISATGPVAED